MEHGDLEEDDEKDQHAHAVDAENAIEPLGRQKMDRLPPGQHDQHGSNRADEKCHHRRDRVDLDQTFRADVDPPSSRLARAEDATVREGRNADRGWSTHGSLLAVATAGASSTMTRPTIMWWPIPQNSLQRIRKSPDAFGVTRRP